MASKRYSVEHGATAACVIRMLEDAQLDSVWRLACMDSWFTSVPAAVRAYIHQVEVVGPVKVCTSQCYCSILMVMSDKPPKFPQNHPVVFLFTTGHTWLAQSHDCNCRRCDPACCGLAKIPQKGSSQTEGQHIFDYVWISSSRTVSNHLQT